MSAEIFPVSATMPLPRKLVYAKWLGYAMLIDLLFLPYFQLLIMPLSLPLVTVALLLFTVRIEQDRYPTLLFFLALAVFVSLAISMSIPALAEYQTENLKRAFQLLSTFAYFFYFRWLARRVELRVSRIALAFLAWFGLLAASFYLDPAGTGEIIRSFYGRIVTDEDIMSLHLRFAYQFTDPNTAAYFLLVAASPLLAVVRAGLPLAALSAALMLLTFVTQSKGALMALALMLLLTLYPPDRFLQALTSVRRNIAVLVIAGAALAVFIALSDFIESNKALELAYQRIFEASDQYATGGSRFAIWSRFLDHLTAYPFGRGFMLTIENAVERPHSDLLRILFSYGIVALIPALLFLFGRLRSFPALVIPGLMAFLNNSLIDEQKLLALFLSLLAIFIGDADRRRALTTDSRTTNDG
jgi:O-antigen ligase